MKLSAVQKWPICFASDFLSTRKFGTLCRCPVRLLFGVFSILWAFLDSLELVKDVLTIGINLSIDFVIERST